MTDARNAIVNQFSPGTKVSFFHDDQWWWGIVKHAYKISINTVEFRIVPGADLFADDNPESHYMQRRAIRVHVVAHQKDFSRAVSRVVKPDWIHSSELPMPNY